METVAVGFGDIKITPAFFTGVLNLELHRESNCHTRLKIEGYVDEETAEKLMAEPESGRKVTLSFPSREGEAAKPRFTGTAADCRLRRDARLSVLTLNAVGMSHILDITRRTRSFQNEAMTFDGLTRYLFSAYPDTDFLDYASEGKKTENLLLQYGETDWEFLRRVFSRFHAPLLPDDSFGGPRIRIGVPEDGTVERPEVKSYSVNRKILDFERKCENGLPEKKGESSVEITMQSEAWFVLGARCIVNGMEMYVKSCDSSMRDGVLTHRYVLSDENGMLTPHFHNPDIAGISLFGRVTEVKNDTVRAALDIDRDNELCGGRWFPYSTVYSSPDGSGWYCMPEIGDRVSLYMADRDEKNAYVRSSVNEDSPSRTNPENKEWSTRHGKRLRFTPGGIEIISGKGLRVRLTDAGGVEMNSPKSISVTAGGGINITSGDHIRISGDAGVKLIQSGAALTLEDAISMNGGKVLIQK
jgi:hypothetical protein